MPEIVRALGPTQTRPATAQAQAAPLTQRSSQTLPTTSPTVRLGGEPLQAPIQSRLEQSFATNLNDVRVHRDASSQQAAQRLGARAFAFGPNIVLGPRERPDDLALMAHETAHVIQQGATPRVQRFGTDHSSPLEREAQAASQAVVADSSFSVQGSTQPRVQRLGLSDALDYFADKANNIPGFRMFTIILGVNPINMQGVDRSAANILRAVIEFLPGGALITQALDNNGVFDKVGTWMEQQFKTLGMVGGSFKKAISDFLDTLSWRDIFNLGDVWNRAKRIFTEPIDRLLNFGKSLVTGIVKFVKDAILRPLAKLAEGTKGYDLLKAVLGEDPVTGEKVPRNAETLIGGFMKLIGQDEIWENIKKSNAISRAWAWFQGALSGLLGFIQQIPTLFVNAFKSLEIMDIVLVPRAFAKIANVFGGFIGNFLSWAGNTIWTLLEIIFAVVAPGVLVYLKKAATAFRTILKNPIGFVGNLVRAGKLGFELFAKNILEHLKTALIKWLTGPLGDAGVYIPKSFHLLEIIKLVLSVLGLTWQNIRSKLVKIIPEPVLVLLEKTAGVLVTLVKDGPAAAWEQIKTELSELKDQMIAQVTQMITSEVVKAAVMKLVSMLNPAGAVVQAIIAIYNTVTFFIQKINQIAAVVASFIDSISAIAAGQVDNAAKKVEQTMANTLTVIIGFLAKFVGLGNVPDKLVGVIKKIRQPIDKGLDKIVGWLGTMLKKVGTAIFGKKEKQIEPQDDQKSLRVKKDVKTYLQSNKHNMQDFIELDKFVNEVYQKFSTQGLKSIRLIRTKGGDYTFGISASPEDRIFLVRALLRHSRSKQVFSIVQINGFYLEQRVYKNPGDGVHSEDVLIPDFPNILDRFKKQHPNQIPTKVEITIKYSPCKDRCTPNIILLKGRYPGIKSWAVYYVELYGKPGTKEEAKSVEAMRELQGADIAITRYDDTTSSERSRKGK
jgi:Domain of unknown function (DUF4157)